MSREGIFKKKKCHFVNRDQILPNAVIFSKLSDSGFRLLVTLNAYPETWVIHLREVRSRLSWGKERMESAIKDCEKHGYLKTTQERNEKGRFKEKEFEFSLTPCYLESYEENSPHNDCEPKWVEPTADGSTSGNPPISINIEYSDIKEDMNSSDAFMPFSPIEDEEEKILLLKKYSLPEHIVSKIIVYPLDQIKNSLKAYDQWIERRGKPATDIIAPIMKAIIHGWKPLVTQEEIHAAQEEEVKKFEVVIEERKCSVKHLERLAEGKLPFKYSFKANENEVILRLDNGFYPISYADDNVVIIVKKHMDKYWIK